MWPWACVRAAVLSFWHVHAFRQRPPTHGSALAPDVITRALHTPVHTLVRDTTVYEHVFTSVTRTHTHAYERADVYFHALLAVSRAPTVLAAHTYGNATDARRARPSAAPDNAPNRRRRGTHVGRNERVCVMIIYEKFGRIYAKVYFRVHPVASPRTARM